MSVDWKVTGKFLKFGIKTYVLPGEEKEMVYSWKLAFPCRNMKLLRESIKMKMI